nr:immunoglobulin heavy chain junction region [Macaca mulatta]MOV49419.1 immunoglobulin heavy chain junction region [Macaca mulatta]MOV49737.1 immunoglobulin heavy chain junction region [Macaca mulatta]MOV51592.1 immunoglobulin heavy chain junction region [Macaca mulatta]
CVNGAGIVAGLDSW